MGLIADGDRLKVVEPDVIDGYEFIVTMLGEVGDLVLDVGESCHVWVCGHDGTPFCDGLSVDEANSTLSIYF